MQKGQNTFKCSLVEIEEQRLRYTRASNQSSWYCRKAVSQFENCIVSAIGVGDGGGGGGPKFFRKFRAKLRFFFFFFCLSTNFAGITCGNSCTPNPILKSRTDFGSGGGKKVHESTPPPPPRSAFQSWRGFRIRVKQTKNVCAPQKWTRPVRLWLQQLRRMWKDSGYM